MSNYNKYLILRDTRVIGNLPASLLPITCFLNGATSLATIFSRINSAAGLNGKLKTLFILAHGIGTGWGRTDDFWWRGGQGLQLGQQGVNAQNVSAWSRIKNSVEMIVVYSCGAAYTGPQYATLPLGVKSDGQALMAGLSKQTNAVVFAADKMQWYSTNNFDFGKWEGTLYMFTPSGGRLVGVRPPIDEIMDIE